MTLTTFSLLDSSRIRYATGAMMYFAQGIPRGLLSIAIPAWLATLGVSASDIATYLAVIILPWAFKLVTGPFMDRFQFPAMGRSRPWVLGAQLGLSLSLLSLMIVEDPVSQIGTLMLIGVLINSFAATGHRPDPGERAGAPERFHELREGGRLVHHRCRYRVVAGDVRDEGHRHRVGPHLRRDLPGLRVGRRASRRA
jgi:hypothetical protein